MSEEPPEIELETDLSQEDDQAEHRCVVIKRILPNRRVDSYLSRRFPLFSRTLIQRWITEQAVSVNDKPTKRSYQLKPGDRIDLILPPAPTREIPPEDIPLEILYEDDHFLAVNKQANLVVHPARGNRGGTLVNGLVHYASSLSTGSGEFRPGIVHRLDRNTTGVILVAKTDTAHWRLARQFEHRQTQKTYIAVVHGTLELDADVIKAPLGQHLRVREKYAVITEGGKEAVTTYQVQRQYHGFALVKLMPKTGRTHQLRIHMSHIKHPIVADTMYGGKIVTMQQLLDAPTAAAATALSAAPGAAEPPHPAPESLEPDAPIIDRQALHAAAITFRHPDTAEPMTIEAPLPPDISLLIELLERHRARRTSKSH